MSAAKRGLGRGLGALLAPTETQRTLPLERIQPGDQQPRREFDEAALAELAASIREHGVLQPLVVSPAAEPDGSYRIVAGERRWRAARLAGLPDVPVIVREVSDRREALELALVENLQRTDLNPVEEAEAFRQLGDQFGLSHEAIAGRVGRGRAAVSNSIRLLKLPLEVLEMLRQGQIRAGQARPLLTVQSVERQLELARRAAKEGLSARMLERLAKADRKSRGRTKPRRVEVHAAAAAERLMQRLQTQVDITRRGTKGQIRIHFHSEEELIRLFDQLMDVGGGK